MAYKALYRVFRPQTFAQVVGQEHIVTVLKNQIQSGQISHAYLFTGSRGTGKTSVAKIFARAISCPHAVDGEACGTCALCQESLQETSVDIQEIDAASNNGVDEIRDLRDKVKFTPVHGKYKVYIIDEVHMLSMGAFNALLKTLEEPPAHAVFVLATTEPQKLPTTVISRCQRYDFHRITEGDMLARLQEIVAKVDAKADDEALRLLCRYSGGGLRDAISLLDQCLVFGEGQVNKEDVLNLLGRSDEEALLIIGDTLLGDDRGAAVTAIDQAVSGGKEVSLLCTDLIEHFRKLMVCRLSKKKPEEEKIQQQANRAELNRIIRVVDRLSQCLLDMRYASQPLVYLELAAIDICTPKVSDDRFALLERLDALERRLEQEPPFRTQQTVQPESEPNRLPVQKDELQTSKATASQPAPTDAVPPDASASAPEASFKEREPVVPGSALPQPATPKPEAPSGDFTREDYARLLKRIKKESKTLYIPLMDSRFVSFAGHVLTIGYPNADCEIAMQAVNKRKGEISAILADMGFADVEICVKISSVDATQAAIDLFGKENIEILD